MIRIFSHLLPNFAFTPELTWSRFLSSGDSHGTKNGLAKNLRRPGISFTSLRSWIFLPSETTKNNNSLYKEYHHLCYRIAGTVLAAIHNFPRKCRGRGSTVCPHVIYNVRVPSLRFVTIFGASLPPPTLIGTV